MNDDLHCMWMWCRFFVADGQGKDKVKMLTKVDMDKIRTRYGDISNTLKRGKEVVDI